MKAHRTCLRLALVIAMAVLARALPQPSPALAYATSWQFPLGGDGYTYIMPTHEKYGTTVVNTGYNVRNLELISTRPAHITCFGIGWHSLYHAGVDFYRQGASAAGATVKAIANGTVLYASESENFPGQAVIIRHDLPTGESSYSVYEHVNLPIVDVGDPVVKGQAIASIYPKNYFGRYPEFYPYTDAHLHFEIRPFYDARTIFPQCPNAYEVGPGYAYPADQISHWFDPIAYLTDRMTSHDVYLPVASKAFASAPPCQEDQDLLQNTGFDGLGSMPSDPTPWLPVATTYDIRPLIAEPYPFIPLEHGVNGLVAYLGAISYGRPTDEELTQSFTVPPGTSTLDLSFAYYITTTAPSQPPIVLRFSYFDAVTGHPLLGQACVLFHANPNPPHPGWEEASCWHGTVTSLANRKIRLAITNQANTSPYDTDFYIDNARVTTNCSAQ